MRMGIYESDFCLVLHIGVTVYTEGMGRDLFFLSLHAIPST